MKSHTEYRDDYEQYKGNGQIEFVTFHPSYAYEDFVESIRPQINKDKDKDEGDGQKFVYHDGIFKKMCLMALKEIYKELGINEILNSWKDFVPKRFKDALKRKIEENPNFLNSLKRYVLIIDEINRGDISKIFGELITLIEDDKRLGKDNDIIVKLPYSQQFFAVPPNLYIVGTMNTADRSLTSIDIALRRRFHFEEMKPELEELLLESESERYNIKLDDRSAFDESINVAIHINKKLAENPDIGRDKRIGHAFFCGIQNNQQVESAWINKIWPLLEEYYYFDKKELEILSVGAYTQSNGWDKNKFDEFIKKLKG